MMKCIRNFSIGDALYIQQ